MEPGLLAVKSKVAGETDVHGFGGGADDSGLVSWWPTSLGREGVVCICLLMEYIFHEKGCTWM